jgi:hypothetical protein
MDVHIVVYCDNISSILTTSSIMLGQKTLRCIIILSKKKVITREINLIHLDIKD